VFVALIVNPDHAVVAVQNSSGFGYKTNFTLHGPQAFEYETRIGSDIQDDGRTFNGEIDEVTVFNRSLSLGEVYSQYAASVGGIAPTLFAGPQITPRNPSRAMRSPSASMSAAPGRLPISGSAAGPIFRGHVRDVLHPRREHE